MILPERERRPLNAQTLNKFYGYSSNPLSKEVPLEMTQINNAIDRLGAETVKKQFRMIISCFEEMLNASGKRFRQLTATPSTVSDLIIPLQIVFMAMHKLLVSQKKTSVNYSLLASKLNGNCGHIVNVAVKDNASRENAINSIYGLIQDAFSLGDQEDPATDDWTLEIINILNKSRTEQTLYDFKIGFVPFNESNIDISVIDQVLKTLTAINNIGSSRTGYVIVGVADKEADAIKYQEKYGTGFNMINELPLCGIEHDVIAISQNLDRYTHTVKEYIRNCNYIPEKYRMHILSEMKIPMIYGKHTFVFKTSYSEPVAFDNCYYLRQFTDVNRLTPEQLPLMFNNYYRGR